MATRAPRRITPQIIEFCREISDQQPVFLDVQATEHDEALNCFENVGRHASEAGGSIQYGWRIWEWLGTFLEAEFHAVLRRDNTLIDVTPAPRGFQRILFLPDNNRVYEDRQVNNLFKPLTNNPLVEEHIRLTAEQFEILNRGHRGNMHGKADGTIEEALAFSKKLNLTKAEEKRLTRIMTRLEQIYILLTHCPCGSLLRFGSCCGKQKM